MRALWQSITFSTMARYRSMDDEDFSDTIAPKSDPTVKFGGTALGGIRIRLSYKSAKLAAEDFVAMVDSTENGEVQADA